MANLFQLTGEMMELMDWMSDPDVDSQAIQDTMEGLQAEIETKAEQYCYVIRQFEADAEMYKKEAERFKQKQTVAENNAKRMKLMVQRAMELTGHEKGMDAGLFKLKVVGNGGAKPIIYDGDVPEQYQRVKYETDAEKVRKYLETLPNPEACAWAHFGDRGTHLSIK